MATTTLKPTRAVDLPTERMIATIIIMLTMAVVLPHVRDTAWGSANTKSRMATVESLVHHGTFAIDGSLYNKTMDRVKIDGKLYSSKPPVLPTIIAGTYFVLHQLTGMSIDKKKKKSKTHMLLNAIFGGGALLMMLVFLYLSSCILLEGASARLFTLVAGAFGFFGSGYAVDINNHLPAAAVGMAAIYFVLSIQSRMGPPRQSDFILAGFCLGLLPTFDMPSCVLSIMLGFWLIVSDRRAALFVALPAAALPIALHFALTYVSTGGLLPVQLRPEVWEPHASHKLVSNWTQAQTILIAHKGIFSMVPLLIPAFIALVKSWRRPGLAQPLSLALTVTFVFQFSFYVTRHNAGGSGVGLRWMIPLIAWLLLFVGVFIDRRTARGKTLSHLWKFLLPAFLAVGAASMTDALDNPWKTSKWHHWFIEFRNDGKAKERALRLEKRRLERGEKAKQGKRGKRATVVSPPALRKKGPKQPLSAGKKTKLSKPKAKPPRKKEGLSRLKAGQRRDAIPLAPRLRQQPLGNVAPSRVKVGPLRSLQQKLVSPKPVSSKPAATERAP